jgi:hypothetical protein
MALDFEIYGKTIQSKDIRYENVNLLESEDFGNFVDVSQFDTLSADLKTNYFPTSGGRLIGDLIVTGNLSLSGNFNHRLNRIDITTPIINLESNRIYNVDTTVNSITGLLPQNPIIGDEIEFLDTRGKWDTNPFYVRSGNLRIEKLSSEDLICEIKYGNFKLNYVDPLNYGWKITTFTNTVTSGYTTTGSQLIPAPSDPFASFVNLLLRMEGSNGSTTFADSTTANRVITTNGSAQISTAEKRFGDSSALFNGTNSFLSTNIPAFFSNDFTIEGWIYPLVDPVVATPIFASGTSDIQGNFIVYIENNRLKFYASNQVVFNGGISPLIFNNQWTYIAVVKEFSLYNFYVNNAFIGSVNGIFNHLNSTFKVGDGYGGIRFFNGYIDEVRVTRAVARYSISNNTFPTLIRFPYP